MANRKARNRQNKSNRIDSRKRVVIAVEGSETEPKYFDALKQKHREVSVKVLRKGTKSSLTSVLKRLDKERRLPNLRHDTTEYWAVIDHDRRPKEELDKFTQRAKQNGYCIADSNPCFELWLILHFKALTEISGLAGNAEANGCKPVEIELQRLDDSFNKSQYDAGEYITRIDRAISNSKAHEAQREVASSPVGTRVYKLAESIIQSSPNNPRH